MPRLAAPGLMYVNMHQRLALYLAFYLYPF